MLSGFACLQLVGQEVANLPQIEPSHLTTFTFEDGLPICNGLAFKSKQGRIYITTCGTEQAEENTYLFEFDGTLTRKIPFHQILGDKNAIPVFSGMTDQGEIYGIIQGRNIWGQQVFIFGPQQQELTTFDLREQLSPSGFVWDIDHHPALGYTIYGFDQEQYHFFALKEGSIEKIGSLPANIIWTRETKFQIRALRQKEAIWLYEGPGSPLIRYDLKTQVLRKYDSTALNDAELSWFRINAIHSYNRKDVYIAAQASNEDYYLYKFNPAEDRFNRITPKGLPVKKPLSGARDAYTNSSYHFDAHGNIIINTLGYRSEFQSAFLLEAETGNKYDYSPVLQAVYQSLPKPRAVVKVINAEDFRKNLFISGWGGISFVTVKPFKAFQANAIGASRAIIPLTANQFFVNTEAAPNAILDLDKQTGAPYEEPTCLKELRIPSLTDMVADKEGKIYIPLFEEKLVQYDPNDQTCAVFPMDARPRRLTFLEDTRLAITDNNDQLFYYDLTTQRLQSAVVQDSTLNFQATVFQIKLLSDGFLWVGAGNGLWKVDPITNEAVQPHPNLSFQNDQVLYIDEGIDGNLWLGTRNSGLQIYNPQTGALKIIDNRQGLSNNTIVSILRDEEDIRWISTYNGINLVSPSGEFLAKIFAEDGLAGNEGNRYSSLRTAGGKLIFGTINGTTVIDPEMAKQQLFLEDSLKIFLTELTYFDKKSGQDTIQTYALNGPISLRLPAAQRFVKLRFALSDYQNNQENSYEYRFEEQGNGENTDWNFLGSRSELNLTNLPSGRYDLVIRGKNYRGQKTQKPIRISLNVKEFFYNTIWFYGLLFLFLSALPFFWLYKERYERSRLQKLVKERTAKIEAQAEQLKSLDEAKSRFFANISHEFRTPLTIISGMINQIRKNPDRWLDKGSKMIEKSNSNLLDLINQILDLQKLEAGHLTANLQLGDIIPFLRTIFEQFQAFAQSKQQELVFTTTTDSLEMDYDPEKTLRIVSNLLSNAIKYTPEKGQISFAVATTQTTEDQTLVLSITDSGIGIAEEKLSNIFDRFYQASTTQQPVEAGTGIGLSLTMELVKLLHGEIKVSSQMDRGTTFTVLLPIKRTAQRGIATDSLTIASRILGIQGVPKEEMGDKKDLPIALVVEDNPDVAQYLEICLEGKYQVQLAVNGQQGIHMGLEIVPDIIVSDVMMPKKNGFELCDTLKKDFRTSHVPIILLTAKSDVESRITGLKQGADDYLAKPFHEEELLVRMQNLLTLRRQLQARYASFETLEPSEDAVVQQEDAFITELQGILLEHLSEEAFGIPELCRAIGMSRTQLHNKIKSLTGKSTSHYIRAIRIHKAKELLASHPEFNITEVAFEIGFSNLKYFSKIFTEETGSSPSQYRKNNSSQQL